MRLTPRHKRNRNKYKYSKTIYFSLSPSTRHSNVFLCITISIFLSHNLFVNNFGDIWWFLGEKNFLCCLLLRNVFLYFMHTFVLYVFMLLQPPETQKLKIYYCVLVPSFKAMLKAFLHLFLSVLALFSSSAILMMIIPKFLCLIFFLSLRRRRRRLIFFFTHFIKWTNVFFAFRILF